MSAGDTRVNPGDPTVTTTTIYQPYYGPQCQPYAVRVEGDEGLSLRHFWTEREAWDARDEALDAGAVSVRILCATCRGCAVVLRCPLLKIED